MEKLSKSRPIKLTNLTHEQDGWSICYEKSKYNGAVKIVNSSVIRER